jgi:hypothetical protein
MLVLWLRGNYFLSHHLNFETTGRIIAYSFNHCLSHCSPRCASTGHKLELSNALFRQNVQEVDDHPCLSSASAKVADLLHEKSFSVAICELLG